MNVQINRAGHSFARQNSGGLQRKLPEYSEEYWTMYAFVSQG